MDHTLAYSLVLINAVPKRSGLVKHPDVPMHSLPTEPRQPSSEEEDWWLRLVKSAAHSCEQACPILRGGFLTFLHLLTREIFPAHYITLQNSNTSLAFLLCVSNTSYGIL
jgi:hypothetical protein